jgi:hypothetical protein
MLLGKIQRQQISWHSPFNFSAPLILSPAGNYSLLEVQNVPDEIVPFFELPRFKPFPATIVINAGINMYCKMNGQITT